MVTFQRRPTALCSPSANLPSALNLSRLARSVCEYLKVLPEEQNEAGIFSLESGGLEPPVAVELQVQSTKASGTFGAN